MRTCRRRTSLAVLTAIFLAVLAATTGCGRESDSPEHGNLPTAADGSPPAPLISPIPAEETVELLLFFPHAHEDRLVQERRATQTRGEGPEELALRELLNGPNSTEARPLWTISPVAGSREGAVRFALATDLKVLDGVADVYLPGDALDQLLAAGDPWPLRAVVETLGQFPRVRAVRFFFDGRVRDERLGDLVLDRPITPEATGAAAIAD